MGRTRMARALAATALLAAALLAGCGGSTPVGRVATPTATVPNTTPSPSASVPVPSGTSVTGGETVIGTSNICTQPLQVNATLPSTIPTYPGAELRAAQTKGTTGVYGFCASGGIGEVAVFYQGQLGPKGWQGVVRNSSQGLEQFLARQGSTRLVLTVTVDSADGSKSNVLLILSEAQSG